VGKILVPFLNYICVEIIIKSMKIFILRGCATLKIKISTYSPYLFVLIY